MKTITVKSTLAGAAGLLLAPGLIFAQDDVGGPYEPDENTIFLMNFDNPDNPWENLVDDVEDAETHGNPEIVDYSARDELGSALRLHGDESWLQIQGTASMDLQEDWTIELWVRVESEGENADILWKPGAGDEFWEGNYWLEMRDDHILEGGAHDADVSSFDGLRNLPSDPHEVETGKWYHISYIRDSEENMHYQVVRNEDLEFEWMVEQEFDFEPRLQFTDLFIGHNSDERWMNGYIDEIRISDVVREELLDVDVDSEPEFVSLTSVPTQQADEAEAVEIETEVNATFEGSIEEVNLHYNTGDDWEEVAMDATNENTYGATIPEQDAYTIVKYYVSAVTNDEIRGVYPANAENDEYLEYYMFAVEEPETTLLSLDFEEGEGVPADASDYNSTIFVHGDPLFTDNAAAGDYAFEFDGEEDFIRAFTPHVGHSEEFTLDFWMQAGDWEGEYWNYLIQKPAIQPDFWGESTIEILTGAFDEDEPRLTAGVWSEEEGNTRITLEDHILEAGEWYRVIFEVKLAEDQEDYNYWVAVELRDADDQPITDGALRFNEPIGVSHHPLHVAKGGGDRPFVDIVVDNFNFYNYSEDQVPVSSEIEELAEDTPNRIELMDNYPNPFNPVTTIPYSIDQTDHVTVKVYDVVGREVVTLVNEQQSAGTYEVQFDAGNLSSGLYIYRLEVGDHFSQTSQMMLVK